MHKLAQDTLQKFLFDGHPVRGMFVRLKATVEACFSERDYAPGTKTLLSEAMCATAILTGSIKFKGRLIFQLQGDGLLRFLVSECDESFHMRALAMLDKVEDAKFPALVGKGQLSISIDQDNQTERYQGMTAICETGLQETVEAYFSQSEQLATRLWLFSDGEQAAGLMLQQLPGELETDFWEHVVTLAETLKAEEILNLDNTDLLHRLYHEEDIQLFEPQLVSFRCGCSLEKMQSVIVSLGESDANALIKERGLVEIKCDFCHKQYEFDAVDVASMFKTGQSDTGETHWV
jgi:molecular chaperone Hsp33